MLVPVLAAWMSSRISGQCLSRKVTVNRKVKGSVCLHIAEQSYLSKEVGLEEE